ncbi:DUF6916 family protein [Vibrio diabolicus]|uniref:DUF6916 family protein n=1 Tax=Vibrio diabolicus TaxID=50719 RepID=UPI00232D2A44|nr:hypothetical protein [Vibrio diabolicus]
MKDYNFENLSKLIGEQVLVSDEQCNELSLTLAEVTPGKIQNDMWESFSTIYKGDESVQIPQGTFTFSHPEFGDVKLFVSPKSPTDYEVIVTRKNQAEQ